MLAPHQQQQPEHLCTVCADTIHPNRAALGYRLCLFCGEEQARAERKSWCVVQEYGKGAYQLVTPTAAFKTLRETNQKATR